MCGIYSDFEGLCAVTTGKILDFTLNLSQCVCVWQFLVVFHHISLCIIILYMVALSQLLINVHL